ncbi:hypothetical protein [Alteromonas gracilis]|uniref:hypothetical protein n=1 Tax=Alteromonas gracilis TaxID=1479524 RepID=UPI0030D28E42
MSQLCKGCGSPVEDSEENYNMFEQMHWMCFHFSYEHTPNDPEEPCESANCPSWHLQILKDFVRSKGEDPNDVIENAIALKRAASAKR